VIAKSKLKRKEKQGLQVKRLLYFEREQKGMLHESGTLIQQFCSHFLWGVGQVCY
jgi:hypothetical protein